MSEVFSESNRLGDWLKGETETPTRFCRDSVTILAGEALVTGTVLGKITASGKWVAWDGTASDGSEDAAAILITDIVEGDTTADALAVALTRGPAVIIREKLTFADSDETRQDAAIAALADLNIITREAA